MVRLTVVAPPPLSTSLHKFAGLVADDLIWLQAKHHPDLIMCRKQPGIAIGRLCEKCDGKCVVCDSYVRPATLVRICDECNYGSYAGRCVICGGIGISDAYYCKECTQQEKDVRPPPLPRPSPCPLTMRAHLWPACCYDGTHRSPFSADALVALRRETAAQRSSTWAQRRRIYSTSARSMASRSSERVWQRMDREGVGRQQMAGQHAPGPAATAASVRA